MNRVSKQIDPSPPFATHRRLKLDGGSVGGQRLFIVHVDDEDVKRLFEYQTYGLPIQQDAFQLWQKIKVGDHFILTNLAGRGETVAAIATDKSVSAIEKDPFPLVVHFSLEGAADTSTCVSSHASKSGFLPTVIPFSEFRAEWQKCFQLKDQIRSEAEPFTYCGFSIRCATTANDELFVQQLFRFHKFGFRWAPLVLIARKGNERVGAILAEPAATRNDDSIETALARSTFGPDLNWIREQSVTIVRILTDPNNGERFLVQEALMLAVWDVAPSLVSGPLSILDGLSYEYLPVALMLGAIIEVPPSNAQAFYYWFPAKTCPIATPDDQTLMHRRRECKRLRAERNMNYWLVRGPDDFVALGIRKHRWALKKQQNNTGRWSSLDKGDTVFIMDQSRTIRGLGVVAGTSRQFVAGFSDFELWIEFADVIPDLNINGEAAFGISWLRENKGGILPVNNEKGEFIRDLACNSGVSHRMWIQPNPFLLPQTKFKRVKNQVFVVQSARLIDSVFTPLRKILEDAGYTAVNFADRDGLLVFSDVWRLLNESEAVLVDFTDRRPNVYLEYGMALVVGKPIIPITQDLRDRPSDTQDLKCIEYEDSLRGLDMLKMTIPGKVRTAIADQEEFRN